jgi:hypothetical protein
MNPDVKPFAWVLLGILLVLVLGSVAPRVGGGVLLLIVLGMVYSANQRGLI